MTDMIHTDPAPIVPQPAPEVTLEQIRALRRAFGDAFSAAFDAAYTLRLALGFPADTEGFLDRLDERPPILVIANEATTTMNGVREAIFAAYAEPCLRCGGDTASSAGAWTCKTCDDALLARYGFGAEVSA